MTKSRSERTSVARGRRRRVLIAALAAIAGVAVLALAAWAFAAWSSSGGSALANDKTELALAAVVTTEQPSSLVASVAATPSAGQVEVPSVVGRTIAEAEALLTGAGLVVQRRETVQVLPAGSIATVVSQDPEAGTIVAPGSTVLLRIPAVGVATQAKVAPLVVCIDPGHQAQSDLRPEPIAPGATETKGRVLGGTTGIGTRLPEYEVTLQIATNLKARLEAAGVKVVMTRTTNDVSISNAERAQVANNAGANLFIRIHCDGSTDSNVAGITTLYPAASSWTSGISAKSKAAADAVEAAVLASTGAVSRGTVARSDQTGFNWSKVPAITVECGFMTNPVEDKLLASPHYQDKLAEGMTNGILGFLGVR